MTTCGRCGTTLRQGNAVPYSRISQLPMLTHQSMSMPWQGYDLSDRWQVIVGARQHRVNSGAGSNAVPSLLANTTCHR